MDVVERLNATRSGARVGRPVVFVHGFGCDQNMWRYVAPAIGAEHPVVLYDQAGCGDSDLAAYDPHRYATLRGYAEDLVELCKALELTDAVLVGHSVGASIAALALGMEPARFSALAMVAPSPRYMDDVGYVGGSSREAIEQLLDALDSNYLGWSSTLAPVIMGNPDRPELGAELTASFCRTRPDIARGFARATFLSDNREDLDRVRVPTLVLQCSDDVIAPEAVGDYVHRRIPGSTLVRMRATGHCPNLSAPEETLDALQEFLRRLPQRLAAPG